jgi:hypothetical protein
VEVGSGCKPLTEWFNSQQPVFFTPRTAAVRMTGRAFSFIVLREAPAARPNSVWAEKNNLLIL